jgi:serine/threonine protein kinase
VLAALRAAHDAGVLHRDVKPANVLMSNDGRVVLTDFGIAMVEGSSALTMTGEVIGSPEFLAPERALGRTPGPESDLWALGVLLYAAVEGHSPFRQNTPLSTLRAIVDEELPTPQLAGPLTPVIEGLLRKDPAQRISAEQAEQDLRLVAAGGSPRASTSPTTPYTPTMAGYPQDFSQQESRTPPQPMQGFGPPPASYSTPTAADEPHRNRRAAAVIIAGVLALALAIGGLTYALMNRGNGDANAGTGTSTPKSQPSDGSSPSASSETTAASETPSPSASKSSSAPQSVKASVAGANTDYSGTCPPPNAKAPTFTASITVGKLPAEVSYRWVTKTGSVSNPGWKTLSFPSGGGKTKQDRVFLTTYTNSGTFTNEISVEIRSPVQTTSNSVPFSVTCLTETPSDGASASDSASPSGG